MARKAPILPDEFGNYTDKQIAKLKSRARNVCVWYLAKRRHTRKELVDHLKERQIPEDIIEETLARLEEEGHVNDESYAKDFIDSRRDFQKLGSQAIRYKLILKGIDSSIIDELLSELEEDDLYETALYHAKKKVKTMRKLTPQKQLQRIVATLAYKGYSGSMSYKAAQQAINEIDDED